jgi:uncharacterized protein (TIGR02285 family)
LAGIVPAGRRGAAMAMMRRWNALRQTVRLAAWSALLAAGCAQAQAPAGQGPSPGQNQGQADTVMWYFSDFPPVHFLAGPNKGQGSGDKRTDVLVRRLPEFRHEIVAAGQGRILDMLKTRPNACNSVLLKTPERAAVLEYSEPYLKILPPGVITTRARLPLFKPFINEEGELRLGSFMDTGKYRLGTIAERSFGPGIDSVLKKVSGQKSVVAVPSSDQFASRLLKLANQNEFDAIVGYATELAYNVRNLNLKEGDFVFLSTAEEEPLVPSYIACNKSDFGKRVIAAINRILADEGAQREADAAYRSWLDADSAARFERLRTQARPTR